MGTLPYYLENLSKLTTTQILGYLAIATTHAAKFRQEIEIRADNGDQECITIRTAGFDLLRQNTSDPRIAPKNVHQINIDDPHIDPLIKAAMIDGTESCYNLIRRIKISLWDRIDPKGLMKKTPLEVDEFLNDMMRWNYWHKDLQPGQQQLMRMICDSYIRWRNKGGSREQSTSTSQQF